MNRREARRAEREDRRREEQEKNERKSKKREAYAERQAQKDREREERERAEVSIPWLCKNSYMIRVLECPSEYRNQMNLPGRGA